jgi:hypothetical protein
MIIDKDKALELLDAAVAAEGEDRTVAMCVYFLPDGVTPNCIVGNALSQIGVTLEDLRYGDGGSADTAEKNESHSKSVLNGRGIASLAVEGVEITPEATSIFDVAQTVQDGRMGGWDRTWGYAVKLAHRKATILEEEQA